MYSAGSEVIVIIVFKCAHLLKTTAGSMVRRCLVLRLMKKRGRNYNKCLNKVFVIIISHCSQTSPVISMLTLGPTAILYNNSLSLIINKFKLMFLICCMLFL